MKENDTRQSKQLQQQQKEKRHTTHTKFSDLNQNRQKSKRIFHIKALFYINTYKIKTQ